MSEEAYSRPNSLVARGRFPSLGALDRVCLVKGVVTIALIIGLAGRAGTAMAEEPVDPNSVVAQGDAPRLPAPEGAQRLSPEDDVWVDVKRGAVLVDGEVCLRQGMLEMFACTRNTKEHESIVSARTKAYLVHTGLIMLGAEPGRTVQWLPEFKPPSGTEVEVDVEWLDAQGRQQSARAQEWIRDVQTGQATAHPWVFAGSRFRTDEQTGRQYYQAEGGDFICVSNFSTAMLDIPIESSQANAELAFEAFTERIPPVNTPVRLVLTPKVEQPQEAASDGPDQAAQSENESGKAVDQPPSHSAN